MGKKKNGLRPRPAPEDNDLLGIKKGWQLVGEASSDTGTIGDFASGSVSALGGGDRRSSPDLRQPDIDFLGIPEASRVPMKLTFVDPQAFCEFSTTFQRPRRIQSISFSTGNEATCFDPVRWEVDGSLDGVTWQRLQTQVVDFDTTLARKEDLGLHFITEAWCSPIKETDSSIELKSIPDAVSERLSFFASSLRAILGDAKHPVRPGRDTLTECLLGNIPSLTQVIPTYNEQVILSEKFLREDDGRSTNLAFMISQGEDEWANFAEKQQMGSHELYAAFVNGDLRERSETFLQTGDFERHKEIEDLILEVRLWASNRSQTLARTVLGAIRYHEVLEMIPCVQKEKALSKLVQLIIAHQTYGKIAGSLEADQNVRHILQLYKNYPVYLVFDYDAATTRQDLKTLVMRYLFKTAGYQGELQYASILAEYNETYSEGQSEDNMIRILEVLPRVYPLVLDEENPKKHSKKTQGKAANQLGALRFASGHYLQMMDANMGAFFGEACKVPFVLRRFQPPGTDRRKVSARIIGFREHIFTGKHGTVGTAMADAEWSFGTMCQRFLAGLGTRMHYGHPDFFDAFWASNRGSVSKASPIINLSEDIFAGFNIRMRAEESWHVDCLEWEKGREVSFNSASQFFTKVSSGSVGVMRSRDVKVLTENLSICNNFSFYFASVGFYLCNVLIDLSMQIYVIVFVLLTLSSKSLNDIGELGSMLAAEWVYSFGVLAMFPRLMEMILEYGVMEGCVRFVPSIPSAMLMFAFMNKSVASAVSKSVRVGDAEYISTGRPNANKHYTWRECYLLYRESHYYPALKIYILYIMYTLLAKDFATGSLPMIILTLTAGTWIVAPIMFCPQPTLRSIGEDLSEFWSFTIGTPSVRIDDMRMSTLEDHLAYKHTDTKANLYDVWLKDELERKRTPGWARLLEFIMKCIRLALITSVVYALMVDHMRMAVLFFTVNLFLLVLWRLCGRPSLLMMLIFAFWTVVVIDLLAGIYLPASPGSLLVAFLLWFEAMEVLAQFILLMASLIIRPDPNCSAMPENNQQERARKEQACARTQRYDAVVEYLYLHTMKYQVHLYSATIILLVDFAVQLGLAFLEMFGGLHSWWLLNHNLRGHCCETSPKPFEPKGSGELPSERMQDLEPDQLVTGAAITRQNLKAALRRGLNSGLSSSGASSVGDLGTGTSDNGHSRRDGLSGSRTPLSGSVIAELDGSFPPQAGQRSRDSSYGNGFGARDIEMQSGRAATRPEMSQPLLRG
eukprot:TRINITY_DN29837_c0_g1_i1.p1 TRINITY_DN29837_c0_g1~~TRINITY_DN29837_c0_g1_i1.p1  ORF type:complete len:1248 (+),score=277.75 TRINITY_DN29837_c0_g1_i1:240-3983(+)